MNLGPTRNMTLLLYRQGTVIQFRNPIKCIIGNLFTYCFVYRSQDDVSIALSVSSCEDDKSKYESKELQKATEVEIPKKTIVILDEPPVPHPLLMKSLTISQHDSLRGPMMGKSAFLQIKRKDKEL